jgi:hypothetical protein
VTPEAWDAIFAGVSALCAGVSGFGVVFARRQANEARRQADEARRVADIEQERAARERAEARTPQYTVWLDLRTDPAMHVGQGGDLLVVLPWLNVQVRYTAVPVTLEVTILSPGFCFEITSTEGRLRVRSSPPLEAGHGVVWWLLMEPLFERPDPTLRLKIHCSAGEEAWRPTFHDVDLPMLSEDHVLAMRASSPTGATTSVDRGRTSSAGGGAQLILAHHLKREDHLRRPRCHRPKW